MDLKAVHVELGKLVAIDELLRDSIRSCVVGMQLEPGEAQQILKQRRAACESRLRALGFVAAHDGTAQTLREFRDREDRKSMPPPKMTGSPQDVRSASSLGFSD